MLRFLVLVISLLCGAIYWMWASQPLWVSGAYQSASYIGYSERDQTVVTMVKEESGAYFEWRELLTGRVVKRVQVKLSAIPALLHAHCNSQLGKSQHDVALLLIREQTDKTYTLPFDMNTGKPVASVDDITADMFDAESCGQRCALFNPSTLFLVDGEQQRLRQLKIVNISNARLLADGKHVACTLPDALLILDWNTGKIIARTQLKPADRYMIFVSRSNDIYLFHYGAHPQRIMHVQRWLWDGLKLSAATSPIPLPQSEIGPGNSLLDGFISEDRDGKIHATCYISKTWPAIVRPALDWLDKQAFNLNKYYPRRNLLLGAVLDRDCSIVGKFDFDIKNKEFHFDRYLLRISQAGTRQVISLQNTNPVWPNAIAVAMSVYLLGYVYRHRKVRVG